MTVRHLDALFRASSLVILGAPRSPAQRQLLRNLKNSVPLAQRIHFTRKPAVKGWLNPELVVVMHDEWIDATFIAMLGMHGCKALLWAADTPPREDVLQRAKLSLIRILGPRSAGVLHTNSLINLSNLPLTPQAGSVALIAQSQSIAAAAVDWAIGRGVGFSWLAVTGAEADIDVADLLDYSALDPCTRAVVLQIGNIRQARKFMSAARAAAHVKPVLVLQTRRMDFDGSGGPDPVRSAAFRRAGMVECETLSGLFEGLAALELLPSARGADVAVIGNGSGVCALAVDAVLRNGLPVAVLTSETLQGIAKVVPQVRFLAGAVDLGKADAKQVLAVLRAVLADVDVDTALLIHSPMAEQPHQVLATAVAKAGFGERLLTVWLGLHSTQPARQSSADAHLATFASAEEALRALRYRAQYRETREMLGQTPPQDATLSVDSAGVTQELQALRAQGVSRLAADASALVLAHYGLTTTGNEASAVIQIRISVALHIELGMALSVQTAPTNPRSPPAFGFPPLDELLAQRMLDDAGCLDGNIAPAAITSMADALVRIGQLVLDQPLIRRIDVVLAWTADAKLATLPTCEIELAAGSIAERQRVALAPYPCALSQEASLRGGRRYAVRAVRPTDEAAVLRLLARLSPEEVRLRFFGYIRHFSHDMAARVTQVDYDRELTLAASCLNEPGEIVALATLIADADGGDAEYAVLVHHDHVRHGLGRHLLERLLQIARERGVAKVHGSILAENVPMLSLVNSLGFVVTVPPDDRSTRHVEISTLV